MLKLKLKKRRVVLFSVITALIVIAAVCVGIIEYRGNQAIAQQQHDSKIALAAMDKKIAKLKAIKKAKEEAIAKAKKEAEQKAAADAALEAQQRGEVVTPKGCAATGAHGNPGSIDVVINKKRCFNPIDFVPNDLVTVHGATISAKVQADFEAMFAAASAAGMPFGVTSSYRSYATQVSTYNHWVRTSGGTAAADKFSARPGYSEHQTGLAIDVSSGSCALDCFINAPQYKWMQANANEYGWIERYLPGYENITGYNPEAWHYRYVGRATAKAMKAAGVKTLEQFWNIPGGTY